MEGVRTYPSYERLFNKRAHVPEVYWGTIASPSAESISDLGLRVWASLRVHVANN